MANNIKGITVEIGGNTGPLTSALKDVNKSANSAQSELKEVNKQLKFDPKNVTLSGQKIDLLKQKSEALEEKQKTLKAAVDQAHEAFEKGDIGADKVRAVEREYEKVNSQLKETKQDLAEAQTHSNSFVERAKGKFSELKYKIKDTFSAENIKAGLGAVGVAVGAFLKGSIEEASEAQQGNADLAQSLKSTKGAAGMTMESLEDLSESLSKNTTFEDDAVKSGEAMLLTFTQIGKDVFPQAAAATLDYAQKMGVDAKSAALTLGKALNDPANGLSKLTRSGVTFTDAQKKQITAMQKAGDTAGAQKLMIAELNKEFGGQAAAAADTYAGKQKQIANQIKEVKEAIGAALMPALLKIAKAITPIIQKIAEFVTQHPKLTAAILAIIAVVGIFVGGLSLANTAIGVFNGVLGTSAIASAAAGTAAAGASVGIGAMLAPILLVVAAIAVLAIGAVAVVTHWKQVKTFFIGLWDTIKGLFGNIGGWFKSVFTAAANGVKSAWSGIKGFFSGLWSGIKTGASTAWNGIKSVVTAIITPFVNGIKNIFNGMKSGLSGILNGVKSIFSGAWTVIKNVVLGIVLVFIDLITGNFKKLHSDLSGILNNIKNAFKTIWDGIKSVVTGIVKAITGAVVAMFENMAANLKAIGEGLKTFFGGLWTGIKKTAVSIWNGLITFIEGLPSQFSSAVKSIGQAIIHGFDDAIAFIKGLPAQMLQWGKDMIQGLVNGIKSATSWVTDAVKGVGNTIRSFLHFSRPDEGPLADYETWMPDMMDGLRAGMLSNLSKVQDASRQVASALAGAFLPQGIDYQMHVAEPGGHSEPVSTASRAVSAAAAGIVINQNNNITSPKALSPAEITRNRRNENRQLVRALKKV